MIKKLAGYVGQYKRAMLLVPFFVLLSVAGRFDASSLAAFL